MKHITRIMLAGTLIAGANISLAADTDGFESALNAGAAMTDGNSDTASGNLGLTTHRVTGNDELKANAAVNYGETEGETVTQNTLVSGQARKGINDRAFGYLGADYFTDDIAEINSRITVGPGLGFNLLANDASKLDVEAGAVWVSEDVGDAGSDDYIAFRFGENLTHQLSESAKLWQSAVYIPEAEDFQNYTITAEVGVESAMTDRVSLRIVIQDRFDNTPAIANGVELEDNDIAVIAGLGVKL